MLDYLIINGYLIDGSGKPGYRANLAIGDNKIQDITSDLLQARHIIDATGYCVTPGFIDLHTHSDQSLIIDKQATSHMRQGITMEAVGNCGFSAAPCYGQAELQRNLLGYIDEKTGSWRDMDGYLKELRRNLSINAVTFVGHAALRSCVMGYENRPATAVEIELMCHLLEECLAQGAVGFSTGLEYFPGSAAQLEELEALCRVVAHKNKLYTTHVRNRDRHYRQGFQEAIDLVRRTNVRCQISHAVPKYGVEPGGAVKVLRMIEDAAKDYDIAFDVIPYIWGSTGIIALLPADLAEQGSERIAAQLSRPEIRKALKEKSDYFWLLINDQRWDEIKLYDSHHCKEWEGMTIAQISTARGSDPIDTLLDILVIEGKQMGSAMMLGHIKSQEDLDLMIAHPLASVISDSISLRQEGSLASLHWSEGCYGCIPTLLRDFVLGRPLLPLETAIAKVTSMPAARLGDNSRGLLQKGLLADVLIIDLEKFAQSGQGSQYAEGVYAQFIAGRQTIANDKIMDGDHAR